MKPTARARRTLTRINAVLITGIISVVLIATGCSRPGPPEAPENGMHSALVAEPNEARSLRGEAVPTAEFRFSDPHTHDNLTILFITGPETLATPVLTLREAMELNQAVVHETGRIELTVEN